MSFRFYFIRIRLHAFDGWVRISDIDGPEWGSQFMLTPQHTLLIFFFLLRLALFCFALRFALHVTKSSCAERHIISVSFQLCFNIHANKFNKLENTQNSELNPTRHTEHRHSAQHTAHTDTFDFISFLYFFFVLPSPSSVASSEDTYM